MRGHWAPLLRPSRIVADACTVAGMFVATYYLRDLLPAVFPVAPTLPLGAYSLVLVGAPALWVWLLFQFGGYEPDGDRGSLADARRLAKVSVLGLLIVLSVGYALHVLFISRTLVFLFVVVSYLALLGERALLARWVSRRLREEGRASAVLVVGNGGLALEAASRCHVNPAWGLAVVGFLSPDPGEGSPAPGVAGVLGTYEDFPRLARELILDQVLIAAPLEDFARLREVFSECDAVGLRVLVVSDWLLSPTSRPRLESLGERPVMVLAPTPEHEWQLFFKRVMDIALSAVGLVLLAPVFLLIAVAIRYSSEGPVFYRWRVVGFNRRPFVSYKFRTMYADADQVKKQLEPLNEMKGPVFKIRNDHRITPVGRLLRKFSLDELPQLYSVLKGDMSLVGPRPPLVTEVPRFESWHRRKLSIKPGITCLWQIKGRSSITDFDEWVKLDLEYIDNWSLWLDVKILLRTLPAVLFARGAY